MSHKIESVTLQGLKNRKTLQKWRAERGDLKVRIWSGEWGAWWKAAAQGYTIDIENAGIYSFEEACKYSAHCGPEKKIRYCLVEPLILP